MKDISIFLSRAFFVACTCLLTTLLPARSTHAADIDLELAQSTLKISTFYNGTTLQVSGSVPAKTEAVIRVDGAKHNVPLKVKGKVAGVLWMNKTDVELENTPSVYMLYTPKNFTITPSFNAGYAALEKDITIIPETADKHFVFGEYIKLMEKSAVYGINNGAVTYASVKNGRKPFTATINIPPKMNAGDYTITAFAVKDSTMIASTAEKLTIILSGLPKAIASLAFGMPLLFGIMAVFIAVATGLVIGVLFKGGGGAH
jgi:hypothetical protein